MLNYREGRSELKRGTFVQSVLGTINNQGSSISCGLARPRSLVGEKPTQVAVSHGPGIEPCRCSGNRVLDA